LAALVSASDTVSQAAISVGSGSRD
jgi:hypothetical protein